MACSHDGPSTADIDQALADAIALLTAHFHREPVPAPVSRCPVWVVGAMATITEALLRQLAEATEADPLELWATFATGVAVSRARGTA